jgi:hypothetical protein
VADRHLVHNPAPFFVGGDVVLPSGRGTEDIANEFADPRIPSVRAAVTELIDGGGPGGLSRLGIRWLLVIEPISTQEANALDHPDLEEVVPGVTARLFRVQGARAPAVNRSGESVAVDPVVAPLARVSEESAITWNRPGANGWMRGSSSGRVNAEGQLELPAGEGPVWYWPAVLVVLTQFFWLLLIVLIIFHGASRHRVLDLSETPTSTPTPSGGPVL